MTNAGVLGRVDFARGARDYVNAVDMICEAPILPADESFEFRFRRFVRNPGHWVEQSADAPAARDGAADLAVIRNGADRRFAFIVETPMQDLSRRPDAVTGLTPEKVEIEGKRASAPLNREAEFWSQMTDCLRHFGWHLFGTDRWAVLGVSGSGACLRPLPGKQTRLQLELQGTRAGIHRLRYRVDGADGREGRLLCAAREGT